VDKKYLIVIVGPTAVGKTSMGITLAQQFNTEIISADSRQLYKQMELGTAKPSLQERSMAKHHFVDVLTIEQTYNAGQFADDALLLLETLFKNNSIVLVVGGSGLYVKALCEGMDEMPEISKEIRENLNREKLERGLGDLIEELKKSDPTYYDMVDLKNPQRVIRALEVIRTTGRPYSSFRNQTQTKRPFEIIKIGLELPREQLYDRINLRMDYMIRDGLFAEAEKLMPHRQHNALQTVGYSEIYGYLDGSYDKEEAIRLLKRNSRRYAKRQLTWFKKDELTRWFRPDQSSEIIQYIKNRLDI